MSENVNKLIKQFKTRTSAHKDIWTNDQVVEFLLYSVSAFNAVPYFTNFTLEDDKFVNVYSTVIVQYAVYLAATAQALIERGREFEQTDNGVSFVPPNVSDLLMHLGDQEYNRWYNMVVLIKSSMDDLKSFVPG